MNGKGDKKRPYDFSKWDDGYDRIYRKSWFKKLQERLVRLYKLLRK